MSLAARIVERAAAYRLWQAPFAEKKFTPVLVENNLTEVRRVLDMGCGPGTNTSHFALSEYLGVDHNERYIEYARKRYDRAFLVADITQCKLEADGFDFILANSFFHHVDDESANRILSHLKTLLIWNGHVHILDLVLPERPSIARQLARWDRGDFPRALEARRQLFTRHFHAVLFKAYAVRGMGVTLWNMVYFKGAPKEE